MQANGSAGHIHSDSPANDWLVCGWFTDDEIYRPLAQQLAQSLRGVGAPYDLACVAKDEGSWEANTIQKPAQLMAAMDRHPDKTILFLDVDFVARGDLLPLVSVPGDVGLKMMARRRRNGSTRLLVSSQIVVVKPTQGARDFVSAWMELSQARPRWGDTDETYLPLAFGEVANCSIGIIDQTYAKSVLDHLWANRQAGRKARGRVREIANLSRWALSPLIR